MAGELGSEVWAGQPPPHLLCPEPNKELGTLRRNHEKAAEGDDSLPGVSCLSQSVQEFTTTLLPSEDSNPSL